MDRQPKRHISHESKQILGAPSRTRALGEYLLSLDQQKRCDYADETVRDIQDGMEVISKKLVAGVKDKDPRFAGKLISTGSFYDQLKVGAVDEFDFLLQMDLLSNAGDLHFLKSEPGFADIIVNKDYGFDWPDVNDRLDDSTDDWIDWLDDGDAFVKGPTYIDASGLQEVFRHTSDSILKNIHLPPNWQHGGCMKPRFSGFRKHGPATLYQFIFHNNDTEVKVNMDLTLAIRIPTPTNSEPFQFNFKERFPSSHHDVQDMRDLLYATPGVSIIPLYSNFMIATGKGDKKHAWKVSCSQVEQIFLGQFDENSLLKTFIRVMKILRDEHLTYFKRKSTRHKKKTKHKQPANSSLDNDDDVENTEILSSSTRQQKKRSKFKTQKIKSLVDTSDTPSDESACETACNQVAKDTISSECNTPGDKHNTTDKDSDCEGAAALVNKTLHDDLRTEDFETKSCNTISKSRTQDAIPEELGDMFKQLTLRDKPETLQTLNDHSTKMQRHTTQQYQQSHPRNMEQCTENQQETRQTNETTTDLTEFEDIDDDMKKDNRSQFQKYDIGLERVEPKPGTGEYYGNRQFVASVEFKVVALTFLLEDELCAKEMRGVATAESVARYVLLCLDHFRHVYESGGAIQSLYFDGPLCTPLSDEKRKRVQERFRNIRKQFTEKIIEATTQKK